MGTDFSEVDIVLLPWAEKAGVHVFTSYRDDAVRMLLRQAQFLERQAKAAETAAAAAVRHMKYIFWAVAILAAPAVANIVVELFD